MIKNNLRLIIGISLPILVVLIVIISVLWSKISFTPKYDFLYTVDSACGTYYSDCNYAPYPYGSIKWDPYSISSGKIIKNAIPKLDAPAGTPTIDPNLKFIYPAIYRYSVSNDTFKQISFEEALSLSLLEPGSAPDGTVIVNEGYNNGVFSDLFGGGRSSSGLYLRNGSSVKNIIVQNTGSNYYYNSNFRLLGWIK
jgi:hypothetical protein